VGAIFFTPRRRRQAVDVPARTINTKARAFARAPVGIQISLQGAYSGSPTLECFRSRLIRCCAPSLHRRGVFTPGSACYLARFR